MRVSSVLVVDDSEGDQFISKLTIEEYDSSILVLQAYDGEEALEVLDEAVQQPEVIFLDINMPRMDGHEFLQAYNERAENDSSVVVMLTSSDQEMDRKRSMDYGFVKKYIIKPLEDLNFDNLI